MSWQLPPQQTPNAQGNYVTTGVRCDSTVPAVGQIWRVVGKFANPLFSVGREFEIKEISEIHYICWWIDGGGLGLFNRETFLERCELVTVKPKIDLSRYPHSCPRCGHSAYVGAGGGNAVDCINTDCPTKKR